MSPSDMHRFTNGNIFLSLIKFAIPFLIANFLISMYGAADVFIISYFADSKALSATATGAQVIITAMSLATGLGLGGTILIGQYFGAKKNKDVLDTISTEFILFSVLSVFFAIFMVIMADTISDWMQTPEPAKQGTINYIRICGGGMIFTFAYETISSVLRGLGDSKNPLKFIAIACVLNVLLDLLFIGYFKWGASGAAAATVIAQSLSAIIGIIYLKTRQFIFDFKLKSFKFIPQKAKMILKLGIPTAIQGMVVFFSFSIMTIAVNKLGVVASAVLGITNRIDGFMFLPALAFGSAVSVMVAQNMGAGSFNRAKQSLYVGFLFSLLFAIPAFLSMAIYPEKLMRLTSSDSEIITVGADFMLSYSPSCLFWAFIFSMDGFLNGCGKTTFTMINNIVASVIFRIPLIFMATTLFEIGLAMPLSEIPHLFFALCYFASGRWKKQIITQKTEPI